MSRIAFLGLGAMGSRMAERLLAAGHELTVWNRSRGRADALLKAGAKCAATPREAAREAEFVVAMVRDDAASRYVWLDEAVGAAATMASSAIGLECSTVSPAWSRELVTQLGNRHLTVIDSPVVGSRPHAERGQLIVLIGAEKADVERVTPLLRAFAATVHHAGPPTTGATLKLAVNALFATQVIAIAELLAMLAAYDIDGARALEAIGATPVMSPAAKYAAGLMLSGDQAPQFPIELAAKDLEYWVKAGGAAGLTLALSHQALKIFNEAATAGLSDLNLTAVADLYRGGLG